MSRIAIVHDWLINMAGAERVLEAVWSIYRAPIFTLFYDKKSVINTVFERADLNTSFLNYIPNIKAVYRNLFPLFKIAVERLNLTEFDIIISSSHSVAKGFKKREGQLHVCYCHTPSRYVWDLYEDYRRNLPVIKKVPFSLTVKYMRQWDIENSKNVDYFIASSKFVVGRIKRIYKRNSVVIYPPVDVDLFSLKEEKSDYYVFVSRLTNAYKKCDIVINSFNKLGKKLIVIGDGEDREKLQKMAKSNIKFLGWKGRREINYFLGNAKALIFPSVDDFGIVSVEAQACGTPVIAYREGGACETVIENETGVFFDEQSPESLINGILRFEKMQNSFDPRVLRKNAEKFSRKRFKKEFRNFIESRIKTYFG